MTFRASFTRQNANIRRLFPPNGQKNALQSVCNAVKADALWKLLKRSTAESTSPLCRVWCDFASTLHYTQIKGSQKNYTNYTRTLHSALHCADSPSVAKCIVCASNYTQTIHWTLHWGVSNPTQRASKTLHWGVQNPTLSVRETIHEAEHKPYILFLNTNLANGI